MVTIACIPEAGMVFMRREQVVVIWVFACYTSHAYHLLWNLLVQVSAVMLQRFGESIFILCRFHEKLANSVLAFHPWYIISQAQQSGSSLSQELCAWSDRELSTFLQLLQEIEQALADLLMTEWQNTRPSTISTLQTFLKSGQQLTQRH